MKIQIFNEEIKAAVKCYLAKEGINVNNYNLNMTVIAGRSGSENRIEIDLSVVGSNVEQMVAEVNSDTVVNNSIVPEVEESHEDPFNK